MASIFSGKAGRNAAMWTAMEAPKYADAVRAILNVGEQRALDETSAGYSQGRDQYGRAIDQLQPWTDTGLNAFNMLADSYGIRGGEGNDRATAAFREAPGYRYQVDQATDAVARQQSALGMLGSGNTAAAISDRAQNLADQGYSNWQGGLRAMGDLGYNSATNQASLRRGIGDLFANEGSSRANIIGNMTGMHANNQQNLGNTILGAGQSAFTAGRDAAANRMNFGLGAIGTAINAGKLIPGLG